MVVVPLEDPKVPSDLVVLVVRHVEKACRKGMSKRQVDVKLAFGEV